MTKQFLVSLRELQRVCVVCPHCKTEMVLDMASFEPPHPEKVSKRKAFTPRECPACQNAFDTALHRLDDLQAAYGQLAKLNGMVCFRIDGVPESGLAYDAKTFRSDTHLG